MTWNYRIVKYKNAPGWGVHEVYYNENQEPFAMTEEPCRFYSDDSVRDLQKALKLAYDDAIKHPVLYEPEKWAKDDFEK